MDTGTREQLRRLRDAIDTLAAGVYYAPEARHAYGRLGLTNTWPGVGPIDAGGEGYFCSRSACLGTVEPAAVAAAFGIFPDATVRVALVSGWSKTTPSAVSQARADAASTQLRRVVSDDPEPTVWTEQLRALSSPLDPAGLPVFAALRSQTPPDDPWARLWRAADLLREHRAGSHLSAARSEVSTTELVALTACWFGRDPSASLNNLGWLPDTASSVVYELQERGLIVGRSLTPAGRQTRERVESRTDDLQNDLAEQLADDSIEPLLLQLESWANCLVETDLAGRGRRVTGT